MAWPKGKSCPEEVKRKIRETWLTNGLRGPNHPLYGRCLGDEVRVRRSVANKGIGNPMYGRHHTLETKLKISKANKGRKTTLGMHQSDETKRKIGDKAKVRWQEPSFRARVMPMMRGERNPHYGKHHSEEAKRKIGDANSGEGNWLYGKHVPESMRLKLSAASKKNWEDIKYVKKVLARLREKPSRLELNLNTLLQEILPGEYKYVGGGQFILGGKCPDFLNVNGKKKLIEAFGIYWHDIFDVARRVGHFHQYGFDTLIVWEDELGDSERLAKKIMKFNRK